MIIKKRTVFVCLCASILMLTVLAFTGCGGTDTEPSGKSTAGQTGAEEKVYSLGEAAKTDELEITITRVEKASEWTKTPPEGYEYAVVFIRAKNISDEAQSITGNQFGFVKNEDGDRGSFETYTGVPNELGYSGSMAPGESVEINLVYAMPADMSRVEFHYYEPRRIPLHEGLCLKAGSAF